MERDFFLKSRFSETLAEDGNVQSKLEEPIRDGNVQPNLEASNPSFINPDLDNLPSDVGLQPNITKYHPNARNAVRRAYSLEPPCQPCRHKFPERMEEGRNRAFVVS